MKVAPGSADVTLYFVLKVASTGAPATGLTVTDLDLTYVRDRAVSVKADLTALASVDAAHGDNKGYEVHSANCPGLYRVDAPDAAFAAGSGRVQLCVNGATIDPSYIECELETLQSGDGYAELVNAVYGLSHLAKPGDAMTLTSDYDAAKSAAGASAVTAVASNVTTLLARIGAFTGTGANTLLGFLKAMTSKAASTPSDIGGTFSAATDSEEALADRLASTPWTGGGAIQWTYTLTSSVDGLPIADADVWVSTDLAGANIIASGRTNASGAVTFYLDAGTVYVWRQKSGFDFVNPDTEVVA